MPTARCPRCEHQWENTDAPCDPLRLCPMCEDVLRKDWRPGRRRLDAFTAVVGILLVVDVVWIFLARAQPAVYGTGLLAYGLLLLSLGSVGWAGARWTSSPWFMRNEVNWPVARWPALLVLMGLASVLGYLTFVVAPGRG